MATAFNPPDDTLPMIELVPRTLRITNILVPTDFSDSAKKAVSYAVAFARQFEARISLLHVYQLPSYTADITFTVITEHLEQLAESSSRDNLERIANTQLPEKMKGQLLWRIGSPYDQICKTATELNSDLIIISTHGYTGLKHVLLGSTTEKVVRHAPCPVLVVREPEHEFA